MASSSIILSSNTSEYSAFNTFRVPMFASIPELDAIITMVKLQQNILKEIYINRPLALNREAIKTSRFYFGGIINLRRLTKENLEQGANNLEEIDDAVDYAIAAYTDYKNAKTQIVLP